MAYRTVLVYLDLDPHCAARVACAAALVAPGGVLVGAAMSGVSRMLCRGVPDQDDDAYLALHLAFLRQRAQSALAAFAQQAAQPGMPAHDARLIDDEAASGLGLEARVADLLVLSQPAAMPEYAAPASAALAGAQVSVAPAPGPAVLAAQVLPLAGRPVLLLPTSSAAVVIGRRILLAWDASRAASRALAGALPLLRGAEAVELVVCASAAVARDVRMADPLPWLARHQVRAGMRTHVVTGATRLRRDAIGAALLALAADGGFDLLVMGAYGHSRLRETFLGSVTRAVLNRMTLPVLLEH